MAAPGGIFAALKKVGDPPLQEGFCAWEARVDAPLAPAPGQWLASPVADIGWLAQPAPDRLLLMGPEDLPARLMLQLHGHERPAPERAILAATGLSGLGGVLRAAQAWKGKARLIALLAFEKLPFQATPSRIWLPGVPGGAIATLPLLEDWKIPCRIAAPAPGCFDGTLAELLEAWRASGQMPDWPVHYFGVC